MIKVWYEWLYPQPHEQLKMAILLQIKCDAKNETPYFAYAKTLAIKKTSNYVYLYVNRLTY